MPACSAAKSRSGLYWRSSHSGSSLRLLQTGQVQAYGVVAFAGILLTGGLVFLLNPL